MNTTATFSRPTTRPSTLRPGAIYWFDGGELTCHGAWSSCPYWQVAGKLRPWMIIGLTENTVTLAPMTSRAGYRTVAIAKHQERGRPLPGPSFVRQDQVLIVARDGVAASMMGRAVSWVSVGVVATIMACSKE